MKNTIKILILAMLFSFVYWAESSDSIQRHCEKVILSVLSKCCWKKELKKRETDYGAAIAEQLLYEDDEDAKKRVKKRREAKEKTQRCNGCMQ